MLVKQIFHKKTFVEAIFIFISIKCSKWNEQTSNTMNGGSNWMVVIVCSGTKGEETEPDCSPSLGK